MELALAASPWTSASTGSTGPILLPLAESPGASASLPAPLPPRPGLTPVQLNLTYNLLFHKYPPLNILKKSLRCSFLFPHTDRRRPSFPISSLPNESPYLQRKAHFAAEGSLRRLSPSSFPRYSAS
ncbi:hypothetical protein KSP40_PGU012073 [Platanthera guangdongensis]|uniref:Uncharacterized protein n=1 Tax=Platanthera guangdongensis TaxID=2320717 RepID=A0ABR2M321_9ASPA